MNVDQNARILDQWARAYSAQDWESLEATMADSVVYYVVGPPEPLKSNKTVRRYFERASAIFPDARITKTQAFGMDEWVCWQGSWEGTQKGPLKLPGGRTIPATNKRFNIALAIVAKFDREKIVSMQDYWDLVSMLTQLGISLYPSHKVPERPFRSCSS